jgi:hypothetical protein
MIAVPLLLVASVLQLPATAANTTLILRNGAKFIVDGPVREERSRVIFRTGGALYSLPIGDVDLDATRAAVTNTIVVTGESDRRLKVSATERDRLLRALEQNHNGTPAAELKLDAIPEPRTSSEASARDEWSWRTAARAHEETIRRAKEEVDLLRDRAEKLKRQIEQFVSLGYHPNQFSYQTTELQLAIDSIPAAELQVTRAQRAYDQFREDARRQGVMPGWLR